MKDRHVWKGTRIRGHRGSAERPVFHDGSGRRRRWVSMLFVSAGVAMVATLGTLVLALTGTSPIPLPGFPEVTSNADRNPAVTPTRSPTPSRTEPSRPDGPAASAAATGGPETTATRKGNVPTHTPDHPRPSKTK